MKKIILLIALITLVAFVSGAMAQQKTTPAPTKAAPAPAVTPTPAAPPAIKAKAAPVKKEKFSGVIEKIDEMGKAITVKGKKDEKTFATDDQVKITKGKETLSFADLKKEMNVSVEYKKDGDKLIALSIKASAPKAAAKKAKEKKPAEEPKK